MGYLLKVVRYKKELPISYAHGATLCIEAMKTRPELVSKIFAHSSYNDGTGFKQITALCIEHGISIERNDRVFNVLSPKENCYVIAEFNKFECPIEQNVPHVVLVAPSNAGNLGTIIRTMVGFNYLDIAIIRPAVDIFDPKVIRASMGAFFHVRFSYFNSFEDYAKSYKNRNHYPFMLNAPNQLDSVTAQKPFSLIFGNEASGLPESFMTIGTPVVIPCSSAVDSLSLPIATSIALYHFNRE